MACREVIPCRRQRFQGYILCNFYMVAGRRAPTAVGGIKIERFLDALSNLPNSALRFVILCNRSCKTSLRSIDAQGGPRSWSCGLCWT